MPGEPQRALAGPLGLPRALPLTLGLRHAALGGQLGQDLVEVVILEEVALGLGDMAPSRHSCQPLLLLGLRRAARRDGGAVDAANSGPWAEARRFWLIRCGWERAAGLPGTTKQTCRMASSNAPCLQAR